MKNWIESMMDSEWYLIERTRTVLNDDLIPSVHYEAYISTSPYDDKPRAGYRLANMQRWFGPDYKGEIEQMIGRHLVDLHNASLKKVTKEVEAGVIRLPSDLKLATLKARKPAGGWPKGVPHLKHPDGRTMKLKEVLAVLENEKQKENIQETSPGVVQEGQPVQTENSQEQEKVQPQEQTQEKRVTLITSSGLYE